MPILGKEMPQEIQGSFYQDLYPWAYSILSENCSFLFSVVPALHPLRSSAMHLPRLLFVSQFFSKELVLKMNFPLDVHLISI